MIRDIVVRIARIFNTEVIEDNGYYMARANIRGRDIFVLGSEVDNYVSITVDYNDTRTRIRLYNPYIANYDEGKITICSNNSCAEISILGISIIVPYIANSQVWLV